MFYIVYDPTTGEILSITNSAPDDLTNCLVTSETLSGSTSDYIVQNGTLYRVQTGSEFGYISGTKYYIVYDSSGTVTAVQTTSPSYEENYITVTNDPGDIVGSKIDSMTEFTVDPVGKGYIDSISELPSSGNDVGDYYILRDANKTIPECIKYIWDGDSWSEWNAYRATNIGGISVDGYDNLPTTGMVNGDKYYYTDEGTDYSAVWNGSNWVTSAASSETSMIPRGGLPLLGNSYSILTSIITAPAGTPTAETQNAIGSSISNIGYDDVGNDIIVTITLDAGNWAVRDLVDTSNSEEAGEDEEVEGLDTRSMVYVIASDYIKHNTVLQINGINRGALRGDILWSCSDGYITFQTDYGLDPYETVVINGVLHSTTDSWAAIGRINAWPQGEWRKVQYQQSANVPNWSVDIRAGDSVLIETPLNMTFSRLLYVSPEWCGNTHAFLTQYYVGSGNHKLYLRITNLATQPIRINDILLSIIYSGNIVNFIAPNGLAEEDSTSTVSSEGATDTYITDEDIDEVT